MSQQYPGKTTEGYRSAHRKKKRQSVVRKRKEGKEKSAAFVRGKETGTR